LIILHPTSTIGKNSRLSLHASVVDFRRRKLDAPHFGCRGFLDVPVDWVQSISCCAAVVVAAGPINRDLYCQDERFDRASSLWVERKDCSLKTLYHHCTTKQIENIHTNYENSPN